MSDNKLSVIAGNATLTERSRAPKNIPNETMTKPNHFLSFVVVLGLWGISCLNVLFVKVRVGRVAQCSLLLHLAIV